MSHNSVVTVDQMRSQLHPVDWAREQFAASEPLAEHQFPAGSNVQIRLEDGWTDHGMDEKVEGYIRTAPADAGGTEYQLTRKAVLELGAFCGMPREWQQKLPAEVWLGPVTWFFTNGFGDREFKLLTQHGDTVLGACRSTVSPFSNLAMLDATLAGIERAYGQAEVLVDYKFHHDLELTSLRLIVPENQRVITGTRVADDTWSTGIRFRNSLIGLKAPEMSGYHFRWWCTNGEYDVASTVTGGRRTIKCEADAIDWARDSVDKILGGLEHHLDDVQATTAVPVAGVTSLVLEDLLVRHHVPRRERGRIRDYMADLGGDLTMYDIMGAVTYAANMDGLSDRSRDTLLNAGGHIAHSVGAAACDRCRRPLPDGFSLPVIQGEVEEEVPAAS